MLSVYKACNTPMKEWSRMIRKMSTWKGNGFFDVIADCIWLLFKKRGNQRTHPDYVILWQQGFIKASRKRMTLSQKIQKKEAFIYPFGGFAFKKNPMHVRDLPQGKKQRMSLKRIPLGQWLMEENYPDRQSPLWKWVLSNGLVPKRCWWFLTKKKKQLINRLPSFTAYCNEIAQNNQVSRKRFYQWRTKRHHEIAKPFLVHLKAVG